MKFMPALLVLGLLAGCGSTAVDDTSTNAVADAAQPEVRYYVIADT